ncbi:hypothetical protein DY000_02025274 [Brassica cretica]|uniref:Uncharacterized protein n=1 Tax=Brassica cretica TaxID=69181 RepID=A0ABQ7E7J3_BRACR|nr:hypothetical protein DY000_02025274 [Brassica cretica]
MDRSLEESVNRLRAVLPSTISAVFLAREWKAGVHLAMTIACSLGHVLIHQLGNLPASAASDDLNHKISERESYKLTSIRNPRKRNRASKTGKSSAVRRSGSVSSFGTCAAARRKQPDVKDGSVSPTVIYSFMQADGLTKTVA